MARIGVLLCGAALATGVATGCGRSAAASDDQVAGKDLFVQKCGSCHTLNRAGTKGIQGPNLDDAFGSARADGLGRKTVQGVVMDQISHVRRGSIMPKDLVKGQDAADVAAYVAAVAGQRGKDSGLLATAGQPKVSNKPIAAKGGTLMMPANPTGALAFASTKADASSGSLKLESVNKSQVQHDIVLEDASGKVVGQPGKRVANGGTSVVDATVKPGKYIFLCSVPGHEAAGMKGTLTVK